MDTKRNDDNDDVHRRCKCKKTKCLKLYCDCFSAGFYCYEACSCKECFNLRDYEDEVQESRECIEERNPLAFSPKIHSLEGGDKLMPNVQKHRKGCICKKSMCMHRYCECYKGKVGCWSNCRCEGCKNVHGMKGGGKCDIMIGTSIRESGLDQNEFINRFTPQDKNGGDLKSSMNL
ncbi:unnamed protein product [Lactuca saligna]|uniref:CRC domain-containing protein n=1 Tax=Lactuca saligna TaxID=75948 RepID=A0AA36EBJ1_LACSI|nr:unnamed protein product [Lactuca saligna]